MERPDVDVAVEITIIITKDMKVMVNGPINNKLLMYGALHMASDAVRKYHEEQRVKPASLLELPPGVRGS